MFQAFDNSGPGRPLSRAHWMALLARAPVEILEPALSEHAALSARWLRAPETGLMMVQGRAGGTGERFNLGEVTVTRCALRVGVDGDDGADPTVGVAYVLGRSHRQVRLAALADALLQDPAHQAALDTSLLDPIRQHLAQAQSARQVSAASTRVDFFTVARESGSINDDGEEDQE
ncbi:phosphonate C-P lyase system protein PhnG [Acidovorax sp. SRB_14]|uniref:phosphonate C-P lyase system protein PhnG n=1 Tax=Acidovorax sp. SRB_14 TaxID=1962699 RepID=UPI001564EC09|nr:phosphonate C-P lyase system protein PhnG [Acidovorax sp. SRB_14]NMM81387.1 phosphonate C-P lyase system protein PhnG [Acidovorax sp. SRB_14]